MDSRTHVLFASKAKLNVIFEKKFRMESLMPEGAMHLWREENISKNVDFSLWGNGANTLALYTEISMRKVDLWKKYPIKNQIVKISVWDAIYFTPEVRENKRFSSSFST